MAQQPDRSGEPGARAWAELERGVEAALETYSNVHRGSGYNSTVSTQLYEQAREIVLETLGLDHDRYVVMFGSPRRVELLKKGLAPGSYRCISSQELGLALGVRALAVEKKVLPKGAPDQTGGGTARLVAPDWVVWAKAPDKFEVGTPAIVNVIALAKALRLAQAYGSGVFRQLADEQRTAADILYRDELAPYAGHELLDELRKTLIGDEVQVPTVNGSVRYVNLDNAASTPTFRPIWEAVRQTMRQPAHVQQAIVQEVKSICAGALRAPADSYDVIFTANTTEAINLAAESLGKEDEQDSEVVVLNTLLEHNSNELPWRTVCHGTVVRLAVDAEGFVDADELETVLRAYNREGQHGRQRIKLVAVSGASNVLGVLNDLAQISRIVHRYGARLLVDAAQLVAHRRIHMEEWDLDYLAFSAHKMYAPFGSGVLMARKGLLHFSPDELEMIRMSGEENAGGIAALGKALVLLQRIGMDVIEEEERALTVRALRGLRQIPGITLFGISDPDSARFAYKAGVIVFDVKNKLPSRVANDLAERGGIGVRYGCHCAHLLVKHVLHIPRLIEQFQGVLLTLIPNLALPGVVRVSLGIENSGEDVDIMLDVLSKIACPPQAGQGRQAVGTKQADFKRQRDDCARAAAQRVYAQQEALLVDDLHVV